MVQGGIVEIADVLHRLGIPDAGLWFGLWLGILGGIPEIPDMLPRLQIPDGGTLIWIPEILDRLSGPDFSLDYGWDSGNSGHAAQA